MAIETSIMAIETSKDGAAGGKPQQLPVDVAPLHDGVVPLPRAVAAQASPMASPMIEPASKTPTTSASQPPAWTARFWTGVRANVFGAGLLVVFVAAAWAMLLSLSDVGSTTMAWGSLATLEAWHLVALISCSLPYILAFCAANLYRWSAFSRYDFRLLLPPLGSLARPTSASLDDAAWLALAKRAEEVWNYESRRFSESRRMSSLHGLIFGLVSSLTLLICTMIVAPYLLGPQTAPSQAVLVAVAVGTAIAFSFAIDLGRIIFRVALRDAGAEIFSFATKNSMLVVASALLFSTLLCSGLAQLGAPADGNDHPIPLGIPGFMVIGATIAIVGARAVRFVTDRATSALGMGAARATEASDLTQIDGLTEEDIGRLAEEGVDSLHALAFIPLPRLYFNTKYSLERLCDWQDQALLLVHVGRAKAQLLRDRLLVRGATSAQDAAQRFFPDTTQPDEKIANLLGFGTYEHAKFALNELARDEVVNRLRVYATVAHTLEWSDEESRAAAPRSRAGNRAAHATCD